MTNKIGLLLPRSVIYPKISFDIANGLKFGLANNDIKNIEIKTENIGLCNDSKLIYATCEKLLFDGANIIAGYVNPITANALEPLFAAADALFIALDSGMHYPVELVKNSHVITLSLDGALCNHAIATKVTSDNMKNVSFTCSFFDSGYRSALPFATSLNETGGKIASNYISPLKRADYSLTKLEEQVTGENSDAIFTSSCGDMAQDFFNYLAKSKTLLEYPIYGSSYMAEEEWLAKINYPGTDIKVCVPWAKRLNNPANHKFIETMISNKSRAGIFSLLGYDAASIISKIINANDVEEALVILDGLEFDSPRGKSVIDSTYNCVHAPIYLGWIQKDEQSTFCMLDPRESITNTDELRRLQYNDITASAGVYTSWVNAYPCIES